MRSSIRFTPLAAVVCAAALAVPGVGIANAQGSLAEQGSNAVPVFNSKSEGALKALGGGSYEVNYANRSGKDLACFGVVLPEKVASGLYAEMQKPGFTLAPEYDEDGEPIGGEDDMDPELEAAFNDAMDDGHVGIAIGEDGISYRDYLRIRIAIENPDMTDEELDDYLDEYDATLDMVFPGLGDSFLRQNVVNFVDDATRATWVATMDEALATGEKAGGIVACFDGVTRDLDIDETTYVEIEHAIESVGGGGGATGTLSSNLFGS